MRAFNRWKNRGFTLIELMIVVAIIGVLAAMAIYGVRRYLLNAKTAEAKSAVGRIAKDAVSAYERGSTDSGLIAAGSTGGSSAHAFCASASDNSVPAAVTTVKGKKYQSAAADWNKGPWPCLKFSINEPQYYMYTYTSNDTSVGFTAVANGDLDGNDTTSEFKLEGRVTSGFVRVSPNIGESNPEE